jgi:hypothetical protein
MKKEDIFTVMETLFRNLSQSAQVEIMTMFYYEIYPAQKDKFRRKIEND